MDGILPVYKPVGISSFDVIRSFKKYTKPTYKVGHGGTLDPFADGVLLLLLGKATKMMNELMRLPKTYRAQAVLGERSETLDVTGTIIKESDFELPSESEIIQVTRTFVGEYEQAIPEYSAAKIGGKPRYLLARHGLGQDLKTKTVRIYDIANVRVERDQQHTTVSFEARVGSGTYIRQLSYDIFKTLKIESYLRSLTRTQIGDFSMEKCVKISDFASEAWQGKVEKRE